MAFDVEARLRLRRVFGVVAPAALVAAAAWFYVGFDRPAGPGLQQAQPGQAQQTQQPQVRLRTDLPEGPGTTEPGIYLRATPRADGRFDVSEVVWLGAPTSGITLRPPDLAAGGDAFAGSEAAATSVELTAYDEPVPLGGSDIAGERSVVFSEPVRQFELTYQLVGTTVVSEPSTEGRASGAVRPLTDSDDLPVVVSVRGASVLNLQCPMLPFEEQSCAVAGPTGLRTAPGLESPQALVVVQLDLPRQ